MDTADKCHICLSDFEQQTVGSLEKCQHVFCLDCILQWSQTANTCPVDRISFAAIHQRQCRGGDIQAEIKVKPVKRDSDDEEQASDAVICEECGRSDRRQQLLVCIHCDSGYHMDCLTPALSAAPEGDWVCPDCAAILPHTGASMVEEISDGELTDLLAEVDDTATPSSRLRPSTLNHTSGFTVRRRSTRLRNRARDEPSPRPQTSLHVPKYLLRASRPAVRADDITTYNQSNTSSSSS
ncbi:PHD and RING finger domain-containing protein 1-like [Solea senegalensis]|uniref:PHD and RING finger domain-containing protein 1-like n=1 Tax=Solea senegalensis TaxID=28829 RepID=A0AAV6SSW6_SOLSE|nr:PHD and RING finger domain-containing protein 1-like [Solea senegalensis]XP_043893273.1 PHD and RING finger domain-containing protein 1-like [Solea senegalensis]KAG7520070.1 PHD and RING finger domain-containing protein 1-like [Solea senegalensis]